MVASGCRTFIFSLLSLYDTGKPQEISHCELALLRARQSGLPLGFCPAVGGGITIDKAKQNLGNNTTTHIAQPLAAGSDLGLFENVIPERRLTMPAQFEIGRASCRERV